MNKRMILYIIGELLLIEAALMLLPMVTAIIYVEASGWYFLYTALGALAVGLALRLFVKPKSKTIFAKEGLVSVALCWIVLAAVGAVPLTLSGEIPYFLDALFEMVSGFTTTGSSILTDVTALSHCALIWRSFSHWIGGMGILVFMLAITKMEGGQGIHLLRAESPGPNVSKMVPRMVDSSKILYGIYFVLTVIQMGFYALGGMPVFDLLCMAFGTAGTGGFAVTANGFNAYSYYIQGVTTVFMYLFGINFSIYFFMLQKKFDLVKKNTELKWYLGIIAASILLITLNTFRMDIYQSVYDAFHHTAFTVAALISSTGYGTVDFSLWPEFSRCIAVFLIFLGASAGSTGGGFKVSRFVILFRAARAEVRKLTHPHTVKVVTMDSKPVGQDAIRGVCSYFIIYILIFIVSVFLVSLDNFDSPTTFTAVATTFNNIGPGLGMVCTTGNFSAFSPLSKIVLCLDMLFGRLELYPMLVLLLPGTWRRK